ncbi:tyrosine-type recombinase/integrase [Mycobacterium sp. 050134]|uniref:tyrosine-type recombinase/integrase n=1 Tax=Mycobacterium sp. 050134 TaxID=3096111 RepID=UPI002ED81D15
MGTRSANGTGNIRKRPNGTWEVRLSYTDADGTLNRVSVYGKTQREVREKVRAVRDRVDNGAPATDDKMALAAWMARWRETTLAASARKASTRSLYASLSRKHIEDGVIGLVSLAKLRPSDVEKLILSMRSATKPGKPTKDKPNPEPVRALSDSTIRSTYAVLRLGLDGAVRDGLLARNPAASVQRPGVARKEAAHLDPQRVTELLAAAESSRYHTALLLIATTGLRRGECLGLRWSDVDLDAGVLRVRDTVQRIDGKLSTGEVKTDRSRRTIPLSPAVVAMLRRHRVTQLEERMRAANQWTDTGLVFTTELGSVVDPRNLLRVVEAAAKRIGLEGVGAHTLRHSAATAWLEAGVHIKQVSDLLGHSSVAITGDVYGHGSDQSARAAVDALSGALGF